MRILHLFSNSKWTGPAEPVVNLCSAMRALGVEVVFACTPVAGSGFNKVVATAREKGLEPLSFLYLSKHRHPIKNYWDIHFLRNYLQKQSFDLIHCHLDNDHLIAARAARGMNIPIVRSNYSGVGFVKDRYHAYLISKTVGLVEYSERACAQDCQEFHFPRENSIGVHGAVDTDRFDPTRALPTWRERLGLPDNAFVFGIVARMQTHRHYEDLFTAFRALLEQDARVHLVIVGRGTRQEEVAHEPVRRLKLEGHVHFPGYLSGDDYVGVLQAFDVGLFLTPGTDGTCRAAREIMAMGKPLVVADRGMLPEIVQHGETGLVTDGSPEALHQAMHAMLSDRELARRLGNASLQTARQSYQLESQAKRILELYRRLVQGRTDLSE